MSTTTTGSTVSLVSATNCRPFKQEKTLGQQGVLFLTFACFLDCCFRSAELVDLVEPLLRLKETLKSGVPMNILMRDRLLVGSLGDWGTTEGRGEGRGEGWGDGVGV